MLHSKWGTASWSGEIDATAAPQAQVIDLMEALKKSLGMGEAEEHRGAKKAAAEPSAGKGKSKKSASRR